MMPFKIKKNNRTLLIAAALLIGAGLLYAYTAFGVTRTWDGGGADANWNTAANWSGDTAPGVSDIASFDGTCVSNCSPTVNVAISVAGINMAAGYTGTITQSTTNTITVGSSHWVQAAGTFVGGSGAITVNGTFTLSGGTFTSTTGTLQVGRSIAADETVFTVSGGTFSHNSGTVKFISGEGSNVRIYTINVVTSLTLYNVEWDTIDTQNNDTLTTAAGDTIIVANDFTQTDGQLGGTWEVEGNVIIGTGADGGGGTLTMTGTGSKTYTYTSGTGGPHLRVNNAALTVTANAGTTTLNVALFSLLDGTFTAPTGTMTVGRAFGGDETVFTVSGGTFTHSSGSIKFISGEGSNVRTYTINVVTSLTLYNVEWATTDSQSNDILTTAAGDTIIAAGNFTHTNGVLNGAWEIQGNATIATTADGGTATFSFTGASDQTYTDQGGNEPNGDVTINKTSGTVTLASNADWNATSQDLTITSGTLSSATYNITTTNFTVNGGTFTGGSGTVTTAGPLAVSSGTFTGGAGNITVNYTFTLSGGAFTSTSGTLTVGRVLNSNETIFTVSGGTFTHNSGTVKFVASGNAGFSKTIDVVTSLTLYNVEWYTSIYDSAILTTAAGDTIIIANDFTQTNGLVEGVWEVEGNVIIGAGADGGAGTLTYTAAGAHTYTYTAGGIGPHLRVNNASATVSANTGTTALTVSLFSLLTGTFTAPTGTMTVGRVLNSNETFFTVSGGTFTHNSGTVKFVASGNSSFSKTIDAVTSLTLYNVEWYTSIYDSAILTTAAGDTIIIANDFTQTNGLLAGIWEIQGNVIIGAGADGGTAALTFTGSNNQTYTDQGGNEPDGDITINKTSGTVTLASNADWNATSQDLIITAGELNMGASYTIATTTLTTAAGGVLTNSGTGDLTLGGTLTNSGVIRFRSGNDCGSTDSILIRSSVAGTQRSWNGTGRFILEDVDLKDMAGSASITAYSSTNTGNNGANWTFNATCVTPPPAAGSLPSSKFTFPGGKFNLR